MLPDISKQLISKALEVVLSESLEASILPESVLPSHLIQARVASTQPDQVLRVVLRLESRLGDEVLLAQAMNLGRQAPRKRRYLTRDTLAEEIGPSAEALQAVETFCQQRGFTLEQRALGGLFITIEGEAGDLAHAFGVELDSYQVENQIVRA